MSSVSPAVEKMDLSEVERAAFKLALVVGDCIKAAGADGIPSGHLYALLMSKGMTLVAYQACIDVLKISKLVNERNNLLTWMGS